MTIPENAEAALAGAAPGETAGVENQRDNGTDTKRTAQSATILPLWTIEACRDAAAIAMLRAEAIIDFAQSAWRHTSAAEPVRRLDESATGMHQIAARIVIEEHAHRSPLRRRLPRRHLEAMIAAADETARIAITQGVGA